MEHDCLEDGCLFGGSLFCIYCGLTAEETGVCPDCGMTNCPDIGGPICYRLKNRESGYQF